MPNCNVQVNRVHVEMKLLIDIGLVKYTRLIFQWRVVWDALNKFS